MYMEFSKTMVLGDVWAVHVLGESNFEARSANTSDHMRAALVLVTHSGSSGTTSQLSNADFSHENDM